MLSERHGCIKKKIRRKNKMHPHNEINNLHVNNESQNIWVTSNNNNITQNHDLSRESTPAESHDEKPCNLSQPHINTRITCIPNRESRFSFKIVSQNVLDIKDPVKLEYIIGQIINHQIDAFLLQETLLKGDAMKKIREHTMLTHGLVTGTIPTSLLP